MSNKEKQTNQTPPPQSPKPHPSEGKPKGNSLPTFQNPPPPPPKKD